jgi:hypothetical protein
MRTVKISVLSLFALVLIGCIVVIVYLPVLDLPLTVNTKAHTGVEQVVHALPVSPAAYTEARPLFVAFAVLKTIAAVGTDVVAITCAYLC